MLHLYAERLAALADETPTLEEKAHLASCRECSEELDAYRRLLERAGIESATPTAGEAPLTDWNSLSARLRQEGMLPGTEVLVFPAEGEAGRAPVRRVSSGRALDVRGSVVRRWAIRAAAAALLLSAGLAMGRATAGAEVLPTAG